MTTLDIPADVQAVEGLKVVEDLAIATLVQIERSYEAAVAHIDYLSRFWGPAKAPPVAAPEAPVAAPVAGPAPVVAAAPEPVEVPVQVAPDALTLVEALTLVQAAAAPAEQLQAAAPVLEVVEQLPRAEVDWFAGRHAEAKTDEIPRQAA